MKMWKIKRWLCMGAAALLLLQLGACGKKGEEDSGPSMSQSASVQEESEQSFLSRTPRDGDLSAPETQEGEQTGLHYIQEGDGANAELTLFEDGTFSLRAVMYDGLPTITGTYTQTETAFVLVPVETNAQNIDLAQLGEMTLTKEGETLIYSGEELGITMEGATFHQN